MLISYGNGFDLALRSAFAAVGQDLIIMFEGQTSQQAGGLRAGRRIRLLQDDARILKDTLPTIGAISSGTGTSENWAPFVSTSNAKGSRAQCR
jgi:hypothetical protein